MIKLTINQEIEILENLGDFIANGSSRAVYEYNDDYVVKVALDKKGQYQNKVEVNSYRKYGDLHLARIQSYGKHIVVMERVDKLDYYVVYDIWHTENYDEYTGEDKEYYEAKGIDESLFYKIKETLDALDEWNGTTSDNYQIGTAGDRVVAYDYGFETDSYEKCVSNLGDLDYYALENVALAVLDILKRKGKVSEILDNYGLLSSRYDW